jgi:hypothetical protein
MNAQLLPETAQLVISQLATALAEMFGGLTAIPPKVSAPVVGTVTVTVSLVVSTVTLLESIARPLFDA